MGQLRELRGARERDSVVTLLDADPMAESRACARCGRASRVLFESPAGDLCCTGCLRYAGTGAEPDPAPRPPAWLDLRAGPCRGCSDQVELGGGILTIEPGTKP